MGPSKLNIEEQFIRVQLKQRITQAKYRSNLTNTVEEKNEYKKSQVEYMQTYRNKKKIELLDFIAKQTVDLQVDNLII